VPVSQATDEPSFTVIPPGPVARGTRLELRLAVQNLADTEMPARVAFFLDAESSESMIGAQTITVSAHGKGLSRVWCTAGAPPGKHEIHYKLETPSGVCVHGI